jgi:DNA-binding LacI/PurR family transcriptional regulator
MAFSDRLAIGAPWGPAMSWAYRCAAALSVVGLDDLPAAATTTPPPIMVSRARYLRGQLAGMLVRRASRTAETPKARTR